jgi:hypothetical protein
MYRAFFKNKHGNDIPITLKDVLHVTGLAVNLLSITKCITKMEFNSQLLIETFFKHIWHSNQV